MIKMPILLIVAVSCAAPPPLTPDQARAEVADAWCTAYRECKPDVFAELFGDDHVTCIGATEARMLAPDLDPSVCINIIEDDGATCASSGPTLYAFTFPCEPWYGPGVFAP